jgi:hypothetical protein
MIFPYNRNLFLFDKPIRLKCRTPYTNVGGELG